MPCEAFYFFFLLGHREEVISFLFSSQPFRHLGRSCQLEGISFHEDLGCSWVGKDLCPDVA